MKQLKAFESAYKFLVPLFISGVFFVLSFYFCLLGAAVYKYSLPFYAIFLLVSLHLFYRIDKELHHLIKKGKKIADLYNFYHNCIGIYLILSFLLFGVSVAYLPFYFIGGSIFVWYCAPMSLLCIISFFQSRKRKKWLNKIISRKRSNFNRSIRNNAPDLTLVKGNKQSRPLIGLRVVPKTNPTK